MQDVAVTPVVDAVCMYLIVGSEPTFLGWACAELGRKSQRSSEGLRFKHLVHTSLL